ncbi:MAG: DUF211 domain-containing protein [Aigarchaeota archaeon]|nr:DUF211 domain-containing protein [Candidatus Pelearchaeum maunauluense]
MPDKRDVKLAKIVIDILKPHMPPLVDFTKEIANVDGLLRVDATIVEVDTETESVKLTVEGNDINLEKLLEIIKKMGAAIHSIDQVVAERPIRQR